MTVHLKEIVASLIAAALFALVLRAAHVKPRVRLRRIARRERRAVRRALAEAFDGWSPRLHLFGRRRLGCLANSFRLRVLPPLDRRNLDGSLAIGGAGGLLEHIKSGESIFYLVNAESGYGKTILGMTLATLPARLVRDQFVPFYIDLAEATAEQPLAGLNRLLTDLRHADTGGLSGHPLFILDSLNEAVDPEEFVRLLAAKRAELDRVGARLLFLFSFRHRAYPGRLRTALLERGFEQLEMIELLFDVDDNDDLAFLRVLLGRRLALPRRERTKHSSAGDQMIHAVRAYAHEFPRKRVSREVVMAYLDWHTASEQGSVSVPPSPPNLLFAAVVRGGMIPGQALAELARVAFLLLSEELTAAPYTAITRRLGLSETAVREHVNRTNMSGWAHCGADHLRFDNETTIRVLGALHVAVQLRSGSSPRALRGRTTYDVCAAYVQSALRWLHTSGSPSKDPSVEKLSSVLEGALSGADAPYSFYATVLNSGDAGAIKDTQTLDTALFHSMIKAIDEDRAESCDDSLGKARMSENQSQPAPVLDQIFEVVTIYGREAVGQLLNIMKDEDPLTRSQAAYLLKAWVGRAEPTEGSRDREALAAIPNEMNGGDGNLHFRFHQVEILEKLLEIFPSRDDPVSEAVLDVLDKIASNGGDRLDPDTCSTVYEKCQKLVCARARWLVAPPRRESLEADRDRILGCMTEIGRYEDFTTIGSGAAGEARLECWEVVLGSAMRACRHVRGNLELVGFIEDALEHDFWIVRWWAFGELMSVLSTASGKREEVLAARCARQIARQLCTAVEPMGLKHRQCAVVRDVLERATSEPDAVRILSAALRERSARSLTREKRQRFAESYYKIMGSSPDAYLWEFFRRLEEIVPSVS
jgi:hypothetical protein